MSKVVITAAATFFVASTVAVSAGGIGFGIGGIGIVVGPGFHSAEPSREYHPRVRSQQEASRPRRQHRQHTDDEEKSATAAPGKSQANENSSIAVLTGKPDLYLENSSIASGPHPAEPVQSATIAVERGSPAPSLHLENSSITSGSRPAEPVHPTTVAVESGTPAQQSPISHPVLCSRYFPNPGQTVQVPCD
jgi:hypothetical protein